MIRPTVLSVLVLGSCSALPLAGHEWSGPVTEGVAWLARHQAPDGSWTAPCATCDSWGDPSASVARTALALGVFLELDPKRYEVLLYRGLDWLITRQDEKGGFGSILDQALAAETLCHALWDLSDWREDGIRISPVRVRKSAESAVLRLLSLRDARGTWGSPELTARCTSALLYAESAKLTAVSEWKADVLRSMTADEPHELLSIAAALYSVSMVRDSRTPFPVARAWKTTLIRQGPAAGGIEYNFWATAALFAYFNPGYSIVRPIDTWQEVKTGVLERSQDHDLKACTRGSWSEGPGRVESTATAVRALWIRQNSRSPFGSTIEDD